MIKVGINGFGRIGSLAFRAAIKSDDIEVVAINAPGHPASHIAYCVKYDSVHGRFDGEVVGNDEDSTVTVNGKVVKASRVLKIGEEIAVTLPEASSMEAQPEDIPLDILYEDEDVLVVNKPKGMVVHPAAGHAEGTLVNAVLHHCGDSLSGINGVMRPGIVHRIDKDTTGSLLICKNDMAHNALAAQLKSHSMERVYHAIVTGIIEEDEGTVDAPIGRSTRNRKKMAVMTASDLAKGRGKDAVTHYRVLQLFPENKMTYIACRLETGRTHQIRVHLAHIGHPLLGDGVYGKAAKLEGQCLHAKELSFTHPRTGERIHVDAPLPSYFTTLLDNLR